MPRERPGLALLACINSEFPAGPFHTTAAHPQIVQGENDPLSNFYQFSFHHDNVNFSSLEQCYQYTRATKAKKPELACAILNSKSAGEAKFLSERLSTPDRDSDVCLMRQLLRAKAEQCSSFRAALQTSDNAVLIT